jgi:hypothetical protein
MSDVESSQTYEFAGAASVPVQDYRATLRVTQVVDGNRAFVEWWATFDCELERRKEQVVFFSAMRSGDGSSRCGVNWPARHGLRLKPPSPSLAA